MDIKNGLASEAVRMRWISRSHVTELLTPCAIAKSPVTVCNAPPTNAKGRSTELRSPSLIAKFLATVCIIARFISISLLTEPFTLSLIEKGLPTVRKKVLTSLERLRTAATAAQLSAKSLRTEAIATRFGAASLHTASAPALAASRGNKP